MRRSLTPDSWVVYRVMFDRKAAHDRRLRSGRVGAIEQNRAGPVHFLLRAGIATEGEAEQFARRETRRGCSSGIKQQQHLSAAVDALSNPEIKISSRFSTAAVAGDPAYE